VGPVPDVSSDVSESRQAMLTNIHLSYQTIELFSFPGYLLNDPFFIIHSLYRLRQESAIGIQITFPLRFLEGSDILIV
jgi:hypothetical protein